MKAIQQLYAHDPKARAISSCPIPKCAECIFGTQTRKSKFRRQFRPIDVQASQPGDAVSTDQMISSISGRVPRGFGKSNEQYTCCTFFVDHFSRFAFAHPQLSTSAYETLIGKNKFERLARSHGVKKIKHYRADNGTYVAQEFVSDLKSKDQTLSYCAPYAHHQNRIAERFIRTIEERSNSMEDNYSEFMAVCSLTVLLATDMYNYFRTKTSEPPINIFSQRLKADISQFHVFGSPVYILDRNLQAGKPLSKWVSRSNRGVYLGRSPNHADNTALVLNLQTGYIGVQHHLIFDDKNHEQPFKVAGMATLFSDSECLLGRWHLHGPRRPLWCFTLFFNFFNFLKIVWRLFKDSSINYSHLETYFSI